MSSSTQPPLCVDFDGTLIKSDSLAELFFRALNRNPILLFILPFWLFKGIAYMKTQLALRFAKYITRVPFNEEFLQYLREQKKHGRRIYLATACEEQLARKLVEPLGIFDEVFGTSSDLNLKARNKAGFLKSKFGENGFDYAGNTAHDLAVWKIARKVIVVNASESVKSAVEDSFAHKEVMYFDIHSNFFREFFRSLRIHQWSKNFLLFVPLVTGHMYTSNLALARSLAAFVLFGICASATYIFNDLLDLESDRAHYTKKHRAIASGALPLEMGFAASLFMIFVAFSGAWLLLPRPFIFGMGVYTVMTLSYSFYLKKVVLLDVMVLAALYTTRIIVGGQAIESEISFWLLTFSLFMFVSLAFVKRFVELKFSAPAAEKLMGRGYMAEDTFTIEIMGIASGFTSVLLYIIYIDRAAMDHYRNPNALISGSIVLLYFICRMWMRANRGIVSADPILAALQDRVNYLLAVIIGVLFIAAGPM